MPPPATAPAGASPEQTDDLDRALARFGHAAFRPGQEEIIRTVLAGQHTVAVMPTGGGKSLCYQLPALLLPGVTVVVSPLIALMRDQVAALCQRGIAATFINSALSPNEREERQGRLASYTLVYVAPERFRSPRFCEALARVPLSLLAVDEAHCISEWGHDFRPDYRRLGDVVRELAPERLLALTATATPEVRDDISAQLGMSDPRVFVHGFDRPNLALIVERAGGDRDKLDRALRWLYSTPSGVAIIYTSTRKKCVRVAADLCQVGFAARPYHAGLSDDERGAAESAFLRGDLPIIVATNAFGMGVDKADVRLVLHYDLPRSPEAYYQEAGRAGRDGAPSRCVLLFNASDARIQEFLIEQSAPDSSVMQLLYDRVAALGPIDEQGLHRQVPQLSSLMLNAGLRALLEGRAISDGDGGLRVAGPLSFDAAAIEQRKEREKQKLRRMLRYGYHPGCLMRFLLDYFGDHLHDEATGAERERCGRCSGCLGQPAEVLGDAEHLIVRKALAAVARIDGRFGKRRIMEVLAGRRNKETERARLVHLSTFGILAEHPEEWLMDLLHNLEAAGLVASSTGEYPTLRITPFGREVMHDRARARMEFPRVRGPRSSTKARQRREALPPARDRGPSRSFAAGASASASTDAPLSAAEEARFERLRKVRSDLASEAKVPAFRIFHDRTLREVARTCPRDHAALARISGIGEVKLRRYGDRLLTALRER